MNPGDRITVLYHPRARKYSAVVLPPLPDDPDTRVFLEDPHPKARGKSSIIYFPPGSDLSREGFHQVVRDAASAAAAEIRQEAAAPPPSLFPQWRS